MRRTRSPGGKCVTGGLAKRFLHMRLRKGVPVFILRVLTEVHMNFACLDFKPEAQ